MMRMIHSVSGGAHFGGGLLEPITLDMHGFAGARTDGMWIGKQLISENGSE
jgi:hypothetical protein